MTTEKKIAFITVKFAFDLRLKKDLLAVDRNPVANDAILTFEKSDSDIQAFCKRPDGRLEFWSFDKEGIKERTADRATLARLNQIGMNEVKTSSDELISFVGMGFIRGPEDVARYVPPADSGAQDYRVSERMEHILNGANIITVRGVEKV